MKKIRNLAVGAICALCATSASIAGPALASLPTHRTLTAGDSFALTVAPAGAGPFQYQWQRNGVDLDGATNQTFSITSVVERDAGNYSVRVSDELATSTSTPCALSVRDGPRLTLVYPGARSTYVSGLFGTNIVGFYDGYPDEEGNVERHGFLYNGSNWTQLRPTNAVRSEARGIFSNRIVGSFTDTNSRRRGYLLQNGVYTVLDYPRSTETRAFGVDGDRIVGEYRDTNSVRRGFLRTGKKWSNLSFPGSVATSARGISGNRIVGRYTDALGGTNGFILEGTNWTRLVYTNPIPSLQDPGTTWIPNYVDATSVSGNTVAGEVNGIGGVASFLYQGGAWQILSSSNLPVDITYGIQGNRLGGFSLESSETGNWLGVVLTLPAPEITLADTFSPVMGTHFSLPITAQNAPAGFGATNLPPGLSHNPTSGLIFGIPSWSGEYLATITASNAAGAGTKYVTFNVQQPPRILVISPGTNGIAGQSYTLTVEAEGSEPLAYQWRKGGTNLGAATNPSLVLNPLAGSDAGTYSVLISNAVGSLLSSNVALTVVSPPQFAVQATNGLRGNLKIPFSSYTSVVSGSPSTFSASNLPGGLSIRSNTGVISGTPTNAGYFRATITASNLAGTVTLPLTFTIPGARPTFPFADNFSSATATRYLPYSYLDPGSLQVTNQAARFEAPAGGTNGSSAGLVLNLPLALTNSWDVSADVSLPNGWETPEAEIGMSLGPMFGTNDTLESIISQGNEVSLVLNRDTEIEGSNNVRHSLSVGGVDQTNFRTTLIHDAVTNARLRWVYQTNNRLLQAWVRTNPAATWVTVGAPLNLDPEMPGSLAQQWGLSNGSSLFLTLAAYAEGGTGARNISLDNLSVTSPVRPVITSTGNLVGQVGQSFAYAITASDNPVGYGATSLPAGLSNHSTTGLITGTPTQAGSNNVILSATGPGGTGLRTNLCLILPAFTSGTNVSGFLNDPGFRHAITVSSNSLGANLKFQAVNPPPGLSFVTTPGPAFQGAATTNGVYTSRVVMSFQGVAATQSIAFSFPAAAGGGFRTNVAPGLTNLSGLPPGLSYNSKTGLLQGIPGRSGNFAISAVTSNGTTTNFSLSFLPSFPRIASPLIVRVKTNSYFFYQIIPGGFGREWAGFDNFDTSSSTNWAAATNVGKANLVRTNGELQFAPGTSNASYQGSHWYWRRIVPSHASWLAYVDTWVSTNRTPMSTNPPGQYGKAQLLAIQTTNTNANPVSLIPVMENMIRSKLYRESGIFRQEAEVTVGDVPWYAGFSSPLDPADYQSLTLKKGVALHATNGQLRFSSTGGNSTSQLALVAPNLRLALSRNWSIRLDAWMDTNWSTPFSAIGLTVIKDSPDMQKVTVDAMAAMLSNNVAMKLKRDDGGANFLTMHFKTNGLEGSSLTNLAAGTWGRLRLRYETNGMKLTAEGNTNGGTNYVVFRQLSLDPAQTNSLGQAWGISGTNGRLRLALWGQTHRASGTGSHLMALDNLEVLIDPPEVSTNLPAEYDWTVCAIGYDQPAGEIISFGWDYEKEEIVELLRTTVADWDLGTQGGFVLVVGGHQQWAGMRTGDVGFDNFALFPWTGEFDFFAPSPPGWLTFHETTGMLSGTAPSVPQTNTVSISVSSEGGTDTRTLEIRVTP